MKRDTAHFKTDSIFHNRFLEMLEDSILANPNLTEKQKNQNILVLYHEFYEVSPSKDRKTIFPAKDDTVSIKANI